MNRVEDALETRYKRCLADLLRFCADEEGTALPPLHPPIEFDARAITRAS